MGVRLERMARSFLLAIRDGFPPTHRETFLSAASCISVRISIGQASTSVWYFRERRSKFLNGSERLTLVSKRSIRPERSILSLPALVAGVPPRLHRPSTAIRSMHHCCSAWGFQPTTPQFPGNKGSTIPFCHKIKFARLSSNKSPLPRLRVAHQDRKSVV